MTSIQLAGGNTGGGNSTLAPLQRRLLSGGSKFYGVPGVSLPGTAYVAATSANSINYAPMFVERSLTIDALATMCQAGVASALVRLGIYDCDDDLQPTSLVLDAGTVDFSTTGFKSITGLSQTLDRGVYLLAAAYSHNGGGQHMPHGVTPWAMLTNPADLTQSVRLAQAVLAFGALPATGPAYTGMSVNSFIAYPCVPRVSAFN